MSKPRSQSDQELLGQVAQLAARECTNGVWIEKMYSKSLNAPVIVVFGLGEQALILERLFMSAQAREPGDLIVPGF